MVHVREIRAQARTALYEGRGDAALALIGESLPALRRTGLILAHAQIAELHMLGALAGLSVRDEAAAARHTRAFARHGFAWAQNPQVIMKAGLARQAGDLDSAITLLGRARDTAHDGGAALYAAAMSRRQGEWMGGQGGRAQVEAANASMTAQGIVNPERMTAMLLGWV